MTVTVANTLINNTWDFWRLRTNQMADVITRQAVTVGGNAAIGTAVIDGNLQVTNTYTRSITGGTIALPADLIIQSTCRMSIDAVVSRNFYANAGSFNYVAVNGDVVANRILVGNTVVNGANVISGNYFGTWAGNTIAINKGGTGIVVTPSAGQVLIGTGTGYALNTLGSTDGISIGNGGGSITVNNTGVLRFRANSVSQWRNGNVTLDSSDIVNALGFVPAVSNTDSWIRIGGDLNYTSGNVAIGIADAGARSNASFTVRTNAYNVPSMARFENSLNNDQGHAFVVTKVANTSALQGYRFMTPDGTVPAGIDYAFGSIFFHTGTSYRVAIDSTGNVGVGTTFPQVNKGGSGIHVLSTNAGVSLDNGIGHKWHLGLQPNMVALGGGARRSNGSFGIFSDEANQGIIFDGLGAGGFMNFVTNGVAGMKLFPDGRVVIGGDAGGDNAKLSVTGDVNATGSFTNYSDYRLKHDVETLPDTGMERIMALNPVAFRWNKNDQAEEGFLAHELQEVVPTAVQGAKDGVVHQVVDKSQLHPVIVKALQELINKVKEQQEQIDALIGR